MEIAQAEGARNNTAALAAMQRAQASPHRDHPALGASFALALLRFSQAERQQAEAAGLPTNVRALQTRALVALPYNPAYWTDAGDTFGSSYEWPTAFWFYDVAFSLPMPEAIARNTALTGKRTQLERVRRDFPDGFLPAP